MEGNYVYSPFNGGIWRGITSTVPLKGEYRGELRLQSLSRGNILRGIQRLSGRICVILVLKGEKGYMENVFMDHRTFVLV